jgi:hypothetical protein
MSVDGTNDTNLGLVGTIPLATTSPATLVGLDAQHDLFAVKLIGD